MAGGELSLAAILSSVKRRTIQPTSEVADDMNKGEEPRSNRGGVRLTERELSVVRLLAKGMTYSEIAATLCITGNTAREYIARIYQKLEVNRRSACVARIEELGLNDK